MKNTLKKFKNFILKHKKIILYCIALAVILIIVISLWPDKSTTSKVLPLSERQAQLEKDPKLEKNVNNPRNNFSEGSYSLDASESSISWKYGEFSGTIPVQSGKLIVTEKGRVGEFNVNADLSKTSVEGSDPQSVKDLIKSNGKSMKMNAFTILPNTNDDAFTVSFALEALGKTTSLATGMFVEKLEDGVKVSGDITLDNTAVIQRNGFGNSKNNLVLTVNYIFN